MDDVRNRLDQDLKTAVSRLGHLVGAAAIEELPWTIRDSHPCADEVDGIQANENREVGLATRELLMERVKRLSAALDRMSEGAYGTCVECGEAISRRDYTPRPRYRRASAVRTASSASVATWIAVNAACSVPAKTGRCPRRARRPFTRRIFRAKTTGIYGFQAL
jgi:RNA polymerase-binding transcription factor DksA